MQDVKRIVCLANSRKLHGRCVAGREWIDGRAGRWIRPVSAREHQEVSEYERQYEDGSDPRVLDIMDVPLLEPSPGPASGTRVRKLVARPRVLLGEGGQAVVVRVAGAGGPRVSPLWLDGHSTYHGMNDTIPLELADSVGDSSEADSRRPVSQLSVFKPGEAFGNTKRRVQGRFTCMPGTWYCLWVTDPEYERRYLAKLDGEYPDGRVLSHRESRRAVRRIHLQADCLDHDRQPSTGSVHERSPPTPCSPSAIPRTRSRRFIALLRQHDVTAVADVRSAPYSRFNPQFNREPLTEALGDGGDPLRVSRSTSWVGGPKTPPATRTDASATIAWRRRNRSAADWPASWMAPRGTGSRSCARRRSRSTATGRSSSPVPSMSRASMWRTFTPTVDWSRTAKRQWIACSTC